jgi:hypothetical protein
MGESQRTTDALLLTVSHYHRLVPRVGPPSGRLRDVIWEAVQKLQAAPVRATITQSYVRFHIHWLLPVFIPGCTHLQVAAQERDLEEAARKLQAALDARLAAERALTNVQAKAATQSAAADARVHILPAYINVWF